MGVGIRVGIGVGMVGVSLELDIDVTPTVLVGQKHVPSSSDDTTSNLGLRGLILLLFEIASLPQAKKMDWQCSSIS